MLNRAIIMGRLTADPELRRTNSDIAVTRFTLAVDRNFTKSGAEKQTDFIDVVVWRQTAEFVCKYFKKGSMMIAEGSIRIGSYTDNQGNKRRTFEIQADNVYFGESKSSSSGGNTTNAGFEPPPMPVAFENAGGEDFSVIAGDDDLPF